MLAPNRPTRRLPAPLSWILGIGVVMYSITTWGHGYGDGYVFLRPTGNQFHVRVDLPLSSLADAVGVSPSALDLEKRIEDYVAYIRERFEIAQEGKTFILEPNAHDIVRVNTGSFVVVTFAPMALVASTQRLDVTYRLFFDRDPAHRGVLLLQPPTAVDANSEEGDVRLIFSPGRTHQALDLQSASEGGLDTRRSGESGRKAFGLAAWGILSSALLAFVLGHLLARLRPVEGAAS